MYRHLWSNGPKECLEFADYSFEEHFGHQIPSYPPREVLHEYITGRVEKAGIAPWVRCSSVVTQCAFDEAQRKFTVVSRNTATGEQTSELFDFVLCCTGHFSFPNVPEFPGMESAACRVMHAHDFRSAETFAGQRILVVGTSYSAEDIASQCHKYGVASVTCSWRTRPMGFKWPPNFRTVPLLTRVEGKTCHFKDGSTAEVDAIILCTGYQHHFPFMAPGLRLRTPNRLCADTLHEGVVWPTNQRLFYIGMQDQW
jgi:trimethylamine monooxygenase